MNDQNIQNKDKQIDYILDAIEKRESKKFTKRSILIGTLIIVIIGIFSASNFLFFKSDDRTLTSLPILENGLPQNDSTNRSEYVSNKKMSHDKSKFSNNDLGPQNTDSENVATTKTIAIEKERAEDKNRNLQKESKQKGTINTGQKLNSSKLSVTRASSTNKSFSENTDLTLENPVSKSDVEKETLKTNSNLNKVKANPNSTKSNTSTSNVSTRVGTEDTEETVVKNDTDQENQSQYLLGDNDFEDQAQVNSAFDIVEKESVDILPSFKGGKNDLLTYLNQNLRYPKIAKRHEIEGTVFVEFLVNMNGNISDISVVRGLGFGCDEEAVRIIREMPDWEPGTKNGRKVNVKEVIPIKFSF